MNKLQKNILVIFITLIGTASYAQRPDYEKIKTLKVAFITEKLALSSNEATAFWPIYNEYETKLRELYKKRGENMRKYRKLETYTEKQASTQLNNHFSFEDDKNQLMQAYFTKMSKHISVKKTFRLIRAEEEFKRELIQQYRKDKKK